MLCRTGLVDSCVKSVNVTIDHITSVIVVIISFQFQFPSTPEIHELEYDVSESESTSTCAGGQLSSVASQSQSSPKSSSDSHLKGPEEPLSKPYPSSSLYPLTVSQSTDEFIVDQEGK